MIDLVLGSDPQSISWWQMGNRAVVLFIFTLILLRFRGRRIFGKNTTFDIVLGVMLGSTLSRALTGNARLFPTMFAVAVLFALHAYLARLAFRFPIVSTLIKGRDVLLVVNGQIDSNALAATSITEHDLVESLRLIGGTTDVENVKAAYLERNGEISVVLGQH